MQNLSSKMPALEEEAAPVVEVAPSYESCIRKEQEEVTDDMPNETIKKLPVESGEMKNCDTIEKEATQEEMKKEEQVVEVAESEDKTEAKTEVDDETKREGVVLRKRRTPEKKEGNDEDVSPPKRLK